MRLLILIISAILSLPVLGQYVSSGAPVTSTAALAGPIAPGFCPPGALPQYCSTQTQPFPNYGNVGSPLMPGSCDGSLACMQAAQLALSQGCPPGPNQAYCLQQRQNQMPFGLMGGPPPPMQQPKDDKMLKVLNSISQAMYGPGGSMYDSNPGERMARSEGDYGFPYGRSRGGSGGPSGTPNVFIDEIPKCTSRGCAQIMDSVPAAFNRCTQNAGLGKCKIVFLGTWGDPAHMARFSCHNFGYAIDIGLPFDCTEGGRVEARSAKALEVARCLHYNSGNLGVIFQDRPEFMIPNHRGDHESHMHVQLRSCGRR